MGLEPANRVSSPGQIGVAPLAKAAMSSPLATCMREEATVKMVILATQKEIYRL